MSKHLLQIGHITKPTLPELSLFQKSISINLRKTQIQQNFILQNK